MTDDEVRTLARILESAVSERDAFRKLAIALVLDLSVAGLDKAIRRKEIACEKLTNGVLFIKEKAILAYADGQSPLTREGILRRYAALEALRGELQAGVNVGAAGMGRLKGKVLGGAWTTTLGHVIACAATLAD